jgi:radical SAM superfamily enzyme YgiQ (UPF0313 family)
MGLGYIASYVRKYGGHDIKIIDSLIEGFNRKERLSGTNLNRIGLKAAEIADRVDSDADFIGINVPFTFYAGTAREVAKELKSRHPRIPIVVGGVYPSTMRQKALHENFDYLVCGEGEIPMLRLLSNKNPEEIKGLIFRNKNGAIIDNGSSESVERLDDIPFPAWDLLPMDTYIKFSPGGEATAHGSKHERYACVITSRQCPFSCTFCSSHPVFGKGWRGRSAENVLEEIRELYRRYKITCIQFLEDNFSFDRKRLIKILDGLIEFNKEIDSPISYNASGATRVDSLDEEIIVKMKEANFISLSLPVEHGDQQMNRIMKKNLDLDKAKQVVAIAKKHDIETHVNILVGHPDETTEIFRNSLNYFLELKRLGATFFHPYILVPFPETQLFKECRDRGLLNFNEEDCEDVFFGYTGEKVYIKSPHFGSLTVKYRFNLLNLKLGPDNIFSKIRFIAKLLGLKRFIKFRSLFVWFSKLEGTWSRDIKK